MNDFFKEAIKQAEKAAKLNEITVGAIIVKNNKIIAKGYNNRQKSNNPLGHAEIIAIIKASKKIKDWRLNNCEMYVTLEPCLMCENIIKEARIEKVYYLLSRKNNINGKLEKIQTNVFNNDKEQYEKMLKNFFEKLRLKA